MRSRPVSRRTRGYNSAMTCIDIAALNGDLLSLALATSLGIWRSRPDGAPSEGPAAPGSAWVGLHVLATLVAYGLFELAFIAGLLYLVEQRQLKGGAAAPLLGIMPSLETLYRLLLRSLEVGVALLTV